MNRDEIKQKKLCEIHDEIISATDGKHELLLKKARLCGGWVANGDVDAYEIEALLKTAADESGHTAHKGECEVWRVIRDGIEYGKQSPVSMFAGYERKFQAVSASNRATTDISTVKNRIDDFLAMVTGYFSIQQIYQQCNIFSAEEKYEALSIITNYTSKKKLRTVGEKFGNFEKVNSEFIPEDLTSIKQDNTVDFNLPFYLSEYTRIERGNVILIAGETNSGKTSLMVEITKLNPDKQFRYISTETDTKELIKKFYTQKEIEEWSKHVEFQKIKSKNISDKVLKNGITIIDYIKSVKDDYQYIENEVRKIYEDLEGGICFVCTQKKKNSEFAEGGEGSNFVPRLSLNLCVRGRTSEGTINEVEVVKCKNFIAGRNCEKKKMFYMLTDQGRFFDYDIDKKILGIRNGFRWYSKQQYESAKKTIESYCTSFNE